jgi:hypothetical protein
MLEPLTGFRRSRRWSRRGLLQASVVFGGVALVGCSSSTTSPDTGGDLVAWPAKNRWPKIYTDAPAEVQEAYRYAVANQDVLQWMPCFCGCGANGHTSNRDCYVRETREDGSVVLDPMSFG